MKNSIKIIVISFILFYSFSSVANDIENTSEYRAFNTPVNYNFAELSVGQITLDDFDIDAITIAGGGRGMMNEHWIFDLHYTGAIIDEYYLTGLINTLSLGLGYRLPLASNLDFVLAGGAVFAWYNLDTYYTRTTDSDLGFSFNPSLQLGITDNLEASIGINIVSIYDNTDTEFTSSIAFYPNRNFGIGLLIAKTSDTSAFGVDFKFNFN